MLRNAHGSGSVLVQVSVERGPGSVLVQLSVACGPGSACIGSAKCCARTWICIGSTKCCGTEPCLTESVSVFFFYRNDILGYAYDKYFVKKNRFNCTNYC